MKFTFNELSNKAKQRAIKDYILGWQETHNEILDENLVLFILSDNDDEYDVSGNLIEQ